jgi:hypothetical protein
MFFVVVRDDDHREVLATHAHCAEQSHSVRTGFKVDYGKIKLARGSTDNLQSVVGAVRQVIEATALPKDMRDTILQLWIVRQKKYGWCLHAGRIHQRRPLGPATIVILRAFFARRFPSQAPYCASRAAESTASLLAPG